MSNQKRAPFSKGLALRYAFFAVALTWMAGADAMCRVTLASLPDAKEIAQRKEQAAAVLNAPVVVRLGEREERTRPPEVPRSVDKWGGRLPPQFDPSVQRRLTPGFSSPGQTGPRLSASFPTTPLQKAINEHDFGKAHAILRQGIDVAREEADPEGFEPGLGRALIPHVISIWMARSRELGTDKAAQEREAAEVRKLVDKLFAAGANPGGVYYATTALEFLAAGTDKPAYSYPPGTLQMIHDLLARGASLAPKAYPQFRRGPLELAAERGSVEVLDFMLREGHASGELLNEALLGALAHEQWAAAERLLAEDFNPVSNPKRQYGLWAMMVRGEGKSRPVFKALIAKKAELNKPLGWLQSPLVLVMHDHELMVAMLEAGADPNLVLQDGERALHFATRTEQARSPSTPVGDFLARRTSVEILLKYGAEPNPVNKAGLTPLMQLSPLDDGAIKALVSAGATVDPEVRARHLRDYPVGPISWALLQGNDAMASALLGKSGRVGRDDCGAIFYAAGAGATKTLELLIQRRANTWLIAPSWSTPLIQGAGNGHAEVVRLLLDSGVSNANETLVGRGEWGPNFNVSALMIAAGGGHADVVKVLLSHGADVGKRDSKGETALSAAYSSQDKETIELLEKANATRSKWWPF